MPCKTMCAFAVSLALAAPLLLPLRAIFPMTYRGQHLYSERASGSAAFTASRAIEWLFPRFGGDPDLLGGGANWLRAIALNDVVYIWCVTFGIVPLLIIGLAALRKEFWNRRKMLFEETIEKIIRKKKGDYDCIVPVSGGKLALGTWQGIYLAEHRARPHRREVTLQFIGSKRTTR